METQSWRDVTANGQCSWDGIQEFTPSLNLLTALCPAVAPAKLPLASLSLPPLSLLRILPTKISNFLLLSPELH